MRTLTVRGVAWARARHFGAARGAFRSVPTQGETKMISSCNASPYQNRSTELDSSSTQEPQQQSRTAALETKADQDTLEAAQHGNAALAHTGGAAVSTVVAAGGAVYGTVQAVKSAAHLAAASGLAVAAAKAWVSEKVWSGARAIATGVARGFASISNLFSRGAGDGKRLRVKENETCATPQSSFLIDEAKQQLGKSGQALENAGKSYAVAAAGVVGAGTHAVLAAGHGVAAAGNAVQAAAERPRKHDSCEGMRH